MPINTVLKRSPSERAVLAHACALHTVIAVLCRVIRFGALSKMLERAYALRPTPARDALAESRAIWAGTTAASFCPFGSTCLTTGLTVRCLLRRTGCDAALRFGVRPETAPLAAHAWLEFAGHVLQGSRTDGHLVLE